MKQEKPQTAGEAGYIHYQDVKIDDGYEFVIPNGRSCFALTDEFWNGFTWAKTKSHAGEFIYENWLPVRKKINKVARWSCRSGGGHKREPNDKFCPVCAIMFNVRIEN